MASVMRAARDPRAGECCARPARDGATPLRERGAPITPAVRSMSCHCVTWWGARRARARSRQSSCPRPRPRRPPWPCAAEWWRRGVHGGPAGERVAPRDDPQGQLTTPAAREERGDSSWVHRVEAGCLTQAAKSRWTSATKASARCCVPASNRSALSGFERGWASSSTSWSIRTVSTVGIGRSSHRSNTRKLQPAPNSRRQVRLVTLGALEIARGSARTTRWRLAARVMPGSARDDTGATGRADRFIAAPR